MSYFEVLLHYQPQHTVDRQCCGTNRTFNTHYFPCFILLLMMYLHLAGLFTNWGPVSFTLLGPYRAVSILYHTLRLLSKKSSCIISGTAKVRKWLLSCKTVFIHVIFLVVCCLRSSNQLMIGVALDKLSSTMLQTCPSVGVYQPGQSMSGKTTQIKVFLQYCTTPQL